MLTTRRGAWIGLAALVAVYALDLHFDLRHRDAFSWMDPAQYFGFARDLVEGRKGLNEFVLPSIFPFFVVPFLTIKASISASLWVNLPFVALLLTSVHMLCRAQRVTTPSPLVALAVVCSPLLIGLSRTLYVELSLSALVALGFVLWLHLQGSAPWWSWLGFALVCALGFMTKMTYPLFFVAPLLGAAVGHLACRQYARIVQLTMVVVVPIMLVVSIQWYFFHRSFEYYTTLGNTMTPIMYLIGPPYRFSWSSASYYLEQLVTTMLFGLAPLLLISLIVPWRWWRRTRWSDLCGRRAVLWLWLLGPLVLLIAQPVKEPRHVAPCVVPAVLLLFLGLEAIPWRRVRLVLIGSTPALAVMQYLAVTLGLVHVPYFIDRPLHVKEIRRHMVEADHDRSVYRLTPPNLRMDHWRYNQNVVIAGFEPNAALALVWELHPAVVFDLETYSAPDTPAARIPYERFEDLFILTGFNVYNRRCGWRQYYATLDRVEIIEHADFIVLKNVEAAHASRLYPGHDLVDTFAADDGPIQLLGTRQRQPSYRSLYARRFLRRNQKLPEAERVTVAKEMLVTTALRGDFEAAEHIIRDFPSLARGGDSRNIYWIRAYRPLFKLTNVLLRRYRMSPHGSPMREGSGRPTRPAPEGDAGGRAANGRAGGP